MEKTLNDFTKKTRHKPLELEIDNHQQHILKKLLATQIPSSSHWRNVYNHISNDIDRIEFRSPGILKNYANNTIIPLNFFIKVFENHNYYPNKNHIIDDFVDKVSPPKGLEYALFFAKNSSTNHKNFIPTLIQFYNDDRKLTNELYDSLINYKIDLSQKEEQYEISELINNFDFSKLLKNININTCVDNDNDNNNDNNKIIQKKFVFATPTKKQKQWTQNDERNFRQNENVRKLKQEYDLPTQHPSFDIVNDLLINGNKEFYNIVQFYPNRLIDKIIQTSQAKEFYYTKIFDKITKREFVKKMFEMETPSNNVAYEIINEFKTH